MKAEKEHRVPLSQKPLVCLNQFKNILNLKILLLLVVANAFGYVLNNLIIADARTKLKKMA